MQVILELDADDIARFRQRLAEAGRVIAVLDECEIVDAAKASLVELPIVGAPGWVGAQLVVAQRLIAMIEDQPWGLPHPARARVLAVLAYLADPDDLIPDHQPVFGLLDDAVLMAFVAAELAPMLEAFAHFCAERAALELAPPGDRLVIARHLAQRRLQLQTSL